MLVDGIKFRGSEPRYIRFAGFSETRRTNGWKKESNTKVRSRERESGVFHDNGAAVSVRNIADAILVERGESRLEFRMRRGAPPAG